MTGFAKEGCSGSRSLGKGVRRTSCVFGFAVTLPSIGSSPFATYHVAQQRYLCDNNTTRMTNELIHKPSNAHETQHHIPFVKVAHTHPVLTVNPHPRKHPARSSSHLHARRLVGRKQHTAPLMGYGRRAQKSRRYELGFPACGSARRKCPPGRDIYFGE